MEPQGSRKRTADQLQGTAVQDQAVQPRSSPKAVHSGFSTKGLTLSQGTPGSPRSEKVVIRLESGTIKGYLDSLAWNTVEELLSHAPNSSPESFRVRHLETDIVEEVLASDIKTVFYVNSFEGDSDHKELNFHTRAPIVHGIWVRVQFLNGEVMEGIVYNSIRYLVDPGFFLLPTDPDSNNRLVYVRKTWLADHRVLGMRKL